MIAGTGSQGKSGLAEEVAQFLVDPLRHRIGAVEDQAELDCRLRCGIVRDLINSPDVPSHRRDDLTPQILGAVLRQYSNSILQYRGRYSALGSYQGNIEYSCMSARPFRRALQSTSAH